MQALIDVGLPGKDAATRCTEGELSLSTTDHLYSESQAIRTPDFPSRRTREALHSRASSCTRGLGIRIPPAAVYGLLQCALLGPCHEKEPSIPWTTALTQTTLPTERRLWEAYSGLGQVKSSS